MEKEQCAILVAMIILIAVATIGFIHTMDVNSLTSKVLPRLLINGEPVNFTTNVTADDINNNDNKTAENLQQAIESMDE